MGLVQGLTEFLPVSSSGHLVLFQNLFGITESQLLFDILLHIGTLLIVFWWFRTDLLKILLGLKEICLKLVSGRREEVKAIIDTNPSVDLAIMVVVATLPTGVIALCLQGLFTQLFGSLKAVSVAFLITGVILSSTRFRRKNVIKTPGNRITIAQALAIGVLQGIAITPGISRSGMTIAGGLLLGLTDQDAARFSFLLSIPAILGAFVLEVGKMDPNVALPIVPTVIGFLASVVSGYFALRWLIRLLQVFHRFAYYLWAVGLFSLWLSFFHI